MAGARALGANIAAARAAKGWSVGQAASAAGLPEATYAAIEAGDDDPRLTTIATIATALGVEVGDLLADVR